MNRYSLPNALPDDINEAVNLTLAYKLPSLGYQDLDTKTANKLSGVAVNFLYWDQVAPGGDYEARIDTAFLAVYRKFGDDFITLLKAKARLTQ